MRPPWLTERLLGSFIEDSEVAEDVLGDLAEEWHERSEREGPRAASAWYRRQAARSAVDVLRSGRGPAPAPALIVALLGAGLPVLLFAGWAGLMTSVADMAVGMLAHGGGGSGETIPLTRTAPEVWAARTLLAAVAGGFVGGLGLGYFSRKAPMAQVTLLAALWVPCALALALFIPDAWPAWSGIALVTLLALGTCAGGVAGVVLRRSGPHPPANGGSGSTGAAGAGLPGG